MEKKKEGYKSPEIKAYGSLAELTKGVRGTIPDATAGGSRLQTQT